jgi:hypothetical protein
MIENRPLDSITWKILPDSILSYLLIFTLIVTWGLLVLDWENLESRKLGLGILILAVCVLGLQLLPENNNQQLPVFVEKGNHACPTFCAFDVVQYEYRSFGKYTLSEGDYVVEYSYQKPLHVSKIMEIRPVSSGACASQGSSKLALPSDTFLCNDQEMIMGNQIPDRNEETLSADIINDNSKLAAIVISGINPRKIGNLRNHYLLTNDVTDFLGKALLFVFRWTRINLF